MTVAPPRLTGYWPGATPGVALFISAISVLQQSECCHLLTCSTQRANSQRRSDNRLRYTMISVFCNWPSSCKAQTCLSDRRHVVRAKSRAAEEGLLPGSAQPRDVIF